MQKHTNESPKNLSKKVISAFRSDLGKSLLIAISWQLIITICSLIIVAVLAPHVTPTAPFSPPTGYLLDYTTHWDGVWYLGIMNGSYLEPLNSSPVFYPLFPTIVWGLGQITFGLLDPTIIALLFNTICLTVAIFCLKKISEKVIPKVNSWIAPALFLLTPAAIFINLFYVEALLCALGFLAYYLALKRMWLLCCIVLAFATSAKLAGLLFAGLCALEFISAHEWKIKKIFSDPKILLFALAPVGFISYSIYLHFVHGDALAMFHDIAPWEYNRLNLNFIHTLYVSFRHTVNGVFFGGGFDYITFVSFLLPMVAIGLTIAASIYSFIKLKNIPLGIFGLVAVVLFTLNDNIVSVHRYLLPVFVIYLALAHLFTSSKRLQPLLVVVLYLSILIQMLVLTLFVVNIFAG